VTGDAQRRDARTDAAFPDADVLVFGHSHIPWDTRL
jgi:predicted phosphodiesterase